MSVKQENKKKIDLKEGINCVFFHGEECPVRKEILYNKRYDNVVQPKMEEEFQEIMKGMGEIFKGMNTDIAIIAQFCRVCPFLKIWSERY